MDFQWIIAPIVGSVIGYTTNWLAIKMLFKPHKAYKFGRIRVPFTPGLIPRERDRIAKSLGTAVGENLLTEEVILKELTNEKITNSLKEYVVNDLLNKDFQVSQLVGSMYDDIDEFYSMVTEYVYKRLVDYLDSNLQIKGMISSKIASSISMSSSVEQLIGDDNAEKFDQLIIDNKLEISNGICLFLADEEFSAKMKTLIGSILTEKLGGLASMFVEPNSLYESILDFARTHLEEEENQLEVANQLVKIGRKFLGKELNTMMEMEQYMNVVDGISGFIENQFVTFFKEDSFKNMLKSVIIQFSESTITIPDQVKVAAESGIEKLYLNFARTRLPIFLEQMNVSGIVEGEINDFTTQQVEDLVFGIVDRELKAITWLGALLGFIMGLVTLFF